MSIWTNLSPEWQQFLVGAAGNALGGLAANFMDTLLRTAGRRISEPLRTPPRQAALIRSTENAITAVIADWQIPNPDYQDLWNKFGAWLLNPAVISEFRVLLTPSADSTLDIALLREEFEAGGLDVTTLGAEDFDALVQDMVGAFYLAAAEEAELQEPLKIGLLRDLADRMGALARLAAQQNKVGRRTVHELQQLNVLAEDVADGIRDLKELLQAILQTLSAAPAGAFNEQQVTYQRITNALTRAGHGDLIYAEVGSNGQNVAVGQHINMTVGSDLAQVQQLLEEIRNSLTRAQSGVSAAELQKMEQNYRQSLVDQFEKLTFRGITPSGKALALDLEKVYVELKAVADVPEAADTYSADERRFLLEAEERGELSRSDTVAHLDALRLERWRAEARRQRENSRLQRRSIGEIVADPNQRGLVILGDPGSGKSTLLHYLALTYAKPRPTPLSSVPLSSVPLSSDLLPIFVPFAAYDDHLRRTGQDMALGDFLGIYYEKWRNLPGLQPLFQDALNRGRALLLLDGLDEVLETVTRQHVAEQAGSLIQQWQGRGNRFVVTSRVVGYREARLPGNLPHVTVLDFSRTEIERFAHQWCLTYEIWAAGRETPTAVQQAAAEEKALLDDVRSNGSVEQLAASPLLLTMLAILRRQVGKLPDRRVELYAVYVRTLIDNREQERSRGARLHAPHRFDPHDAIAHLIELALWLQLNRPSGTARRQDLAQALMEICLRYEGYPESTQAPPKACAKAQRDAEAFLQDMRHFAGLLGERGRDAFGFLHLTFQEYFAGRALAKMDADARWQLIQPNLHQPRWREPILLCAGQLGVIEQRRDVVNDLAQRILTADSLHEPILHRDLFLAASMMADDVGLTMALLTQIYEQLHPLLSSNIPSLQAKVISGLGHLSRLGHLAAQNVLIAGLVQSDLQLVLLRNLTPFLAEATCQPLLSAVRQRLTDENWQMRRAAVVGLAGLVSSDAEIRHDLRQRLTDSFYDVRLAAVQALAGLVSSDAEIRHDLRQRLTDESIGVRLAAVQALAPQVTMDATLLQQLIPWFGLITEDDYRFPGQEELVRATQPRLVEVYAALLTKRPPLLEQFIALLDVVAWPLRLGAARALIAMPGGPPLAVLPKLRHLLYDMRGEESWPNRLTTAELFINEQDRELSHQAITTAIEALDYATQPWYYLPRSGVEVRKQAATILGQLDPLYRDEKIFTRLARVLEEDKDPQVRDAAYGALLRLAAAPERTTAD